MVQAGERSLTRDIGHDLLEATLDRIAGRKILDAATFDAHEMMVVSAQPLGQLVAGESRRRVVRCQHARLLEDRERPVQRRQWHRLADGLAQFGGRTRTVGVGEGADDDAPTLRIANVGFCEPAFDLTIEG